MLDTKPVDKRGSEVCVQVSGDVRFGGDPVQEFARLVTSGRGFRQKDLQMAQRNRRKGKTKGTGRMLPVLHPEAAGIDIGAEELFVAVSPDRSAESVRSFELFTRDLHELADWMQSCGVRTVAMESTGV